MKRIEYKRLSTLELKRFKVQFEMLFKKDLADSVKTGVVVPGLETRWADWKKAHDRKGTIKETVKDLLTANFHQLLDVYERFMALGIPEEVKNSKNKWVRNPDLKELDDIFDYSHKYDDRIARFFNVWSEKLGITSCYYCEMAYINTYIADLKKGRKVILKRQFDLDHFLPKAKCPCLGLSLYNFVPSCQVCNSRIKGDRMPRGLAPKDYELISPSSDKADFDNNLHFRLRMHPKGKSLLAGRYIYVRANSPYKEYANFFHLGERYSFHKKEAFRLKRLKQRYPDSKIKKIANLLHYRPSKVYDDIFNEKYLNQEGRCFEKFTRDMLE